VSVRLSGLSAPLIYRHQQRRAAGLLLSAGAGKRYRSIVAGASDLLQAGARGQRPAKSRGMKLNVR